MRLLDLMGCLELTRGKDFFNLIGAGVNKSLDSCRREGDKCIDMLGDVTQQHRFIISVSWRDPLSAALYHQNMEGITNKSVAPLQTMEGIIDSRSGTSPTIVVHKAEK